MSKRKTPNPELPSVELPPPPPPPTAELRREAQSNTTMKRGLFSRWWYVMFAPSILLMVWYLYMMPTWIEAGNVKEREWQEMKQRLSRIEQQLEQSKK